MNYSLAGEITKVGTTAAQFLKIGVGARASAMGESYVAAANDVSAIFWNPAGLAHISKNEGMFVRTQWIADMTFDFAGLAFPLANWGTVGLFYSGLNMSDMQVRTEYKPEGTGELFTASSLNLGVSFARKMTERFAFGVNGKYIREQIWHETASTMAVDVGITYFSTIKDLALGMAISNYGGKMQMTGKEFLRFVDIDPNLEGNNENVIASLNAEKYDIPLVFRIGAAYKALNSDFHRIIFVMDGVSPNDYTEYLNLGMEYGFREMVFLRAGYKGYGIDKREGGITLGGGITYQFLEGLGLNMDYAFMDFGRLGPVQRYSVKLIF
jgi:hypothetical protein